ncbi:MAG TPA: glycosyltransferase family 39 protein [Polyangia bacterium]|nr:glycosyltransferase family 39 protein [Polyangia bacterium]
MIALVVRHVLVLTALTLAAWSLGARVVRRVPFVDALERAVVGCALGLGAIAYLVLALGLAHALTPPWAFGLVGGLALVAAPWSTLRQLAPRKIARGASFALVVIALTLPWWGRALAPPIDYDATMYHLTAARWFAARHAVFPTVPLRYPGVPRLQEMLFTLMLLGGSESAAQGTQTIAAALVTLALVAAGRRLQAPRAGFFAAALWLGSPLVMRLAASGYIDVGLTLFATIATTATLAWQRDRQRAWLVVAGVAAGFAAANKYTGLVVAAALALVVFVDGGGLRLRNTIAFGALAAVVGAPFYVLNALWCGNPVFPFAAGVFGPGWWNADDLRWQLVDLRQLGAGRSLAALARLPVRLLAAQRPFAQEGPWISPAYALLAPLTVWQARRDRRLVALGVVVAVFAIVWFAGAQSLRYLLPVLPAAALAHGLALDRVLPSSRRLTFVVVAVLAAWGVLDGAWQWVSDLPPSPTGRVAWLSARLRGYAAVDWLNRSAPGQRVFQLDHERFAYFADSGVDDGWRGDAYGPYRESRIRSRLGDAARLAGELRAMDTRFLLVPRAFALPETTPFTTRFDRRYADADDIIYALR